MNCDLSLLPSLWSVEFVVCWWNSGVQLYWPWWCNNLKVRRRNWHDFEVRYAENGNCIFFKYHYIATIRLQSSGRWRRQPESIVETMSIKLKTSLFSIIGWVWDLTHQIFGSHTQPSHSYQTHSLEQCMHWNSACKIRILFMSSMGCMQPVVTFTLGVTPRRFVNDLGTLLLRKKSQCSFISISMYTSNSSPYSQRRVIEPEHTSRQVFNCNQRVDIFRPYMVNTWCVMKLQNENNRNVLDVVP